MNQQAIAAYAEAWSKEEKIAILRGLSLAYDYESVGAICEYILEGTIPQVLPVAAPSRKLRKTAKGSVR